MFPVARFSLEKETNQNALFYSLRSIHWLELMAKCVAHSSTRKQVMI